MESTRSEMLRRAIAASSINKIAAAVGLSRQAVSAWTDIPVKYLPEIVALTGIPAAELAPEYVARLRA